MDELHNQLKTMNCQFGFYMKHRTAMKNNLVGILDQTYLVLILTLTALLVVTTDKNGLVLYPIYWHINCVGKMPVNAFIDHYQKWCKRKKYNFSQAKTREIYEKAKKLVLVLSKNEIIKLIINQAVD